MLVVVVAVLSGLAVCLPVAAAQEPGQEPVGNDVESKEVQKDVVIAPVGRHPLGFDADVNGDEVIWYSNRSRYGSVVSNAVRVWNDLDARYNGRGVRFRNISTAPGGTRLELIFRDSRCSSYAFYDPNRNPDEIVFCVNNMRTLGALRQHEVGAHEAGHSIGLAHPEPCRSYLGISIMVGACGFSDSRKPLSHDIRDYFNRWVR